MKTTYWAGILALLLLLGGCGFSRAGGATAVPDLPEEVPAPAGPADEFQVIDPLEQAMEITAVQSAVLEQSPFDGPDEKDADNAYLYKDSIPEPEEAPAWVQGRQMDTEKICAALLRLINEDRQREGMEHLGLEEDIGAAARIRAQEILEDLSHTRPDGDPYYTAFDDAGFSYSGKWHGENICRILIPTDTFDEEMAAKQLFQNLRGTPGHYYNLQRENFLQVGIGIDIQYDEDYTKVACVQLFASL